MDFVPTKDNIINLHRIPDLYSNSKCEKKNSVSWAHAYNYVHVLENGHHFCASNFSGRVIGTYISIMAEGMDQYQVSIVGAHLMGKVT